MKRRRRQSTFFATVLLSGVLALPAAAATAPSKVIAKGARLKGSNIWFVQGKAKRPRTLSARIVPIPVQKVKVHWAVVCQRSDPHDPAVHVSTKGTSGEVSLRAAATVKLSLPYAKPPTCVATVYATPAATGRVTLRLLQT